MATQIPNVSTIPGFPKRGIPKRDIFVNSQETAQDHLSDVFSNEINNSINALNIVSGEVETNAANAQISEDNAKNYADIAQSSANYKGDWVAGYNTTGYSLGMSVTYTDGADYVSKINNNLAEPTGAGDANWNKILFSQNIQQPIITSPTNGQTGFIGDIISNAFSTFEDNYTGTQDYVQWQLATDSAFTAVVDSYSGASNLTQWTPTTSPLTSYYVRVRKGSDSHLSPWSSTINFTTADTYIQTPTVTAPTDGSTGIATSPVITTSAFTVVGGSDTHVSTDYQIATDTAFTNIVYEALASGDLVSHVVSATLNQTTTYYVRVRHNGATYTSDFSAYNTFTTLTFLEKIKLIGGAGSDIFYSVVVDSSGNYIAVGNSASAGAGSNDAYIAKFDSSLNLIDDKLIGGAGSDIFYSVAVDSSGNYIAVGNSASAGAGSDDAYIAKFDSSLNLIDDKLIGGGTTDRFYSVAVDSSGNYIAVGNSDSAGAGSNDAYIAKFDSSLNLIDGKLIGGAGSDLFRSVVVDSSGNYIAVGNSASAGAGSNDAYIAKFDSSLNLIDDKLIGGAGSDIFYSVAVDSSGNYIAVGNSASAGAGSDDAYIAKFDSSLNLIDDKLIGGGTTDRFYSVAVDSSGNYIAVGNSDSAGAGSNDAYIAKFDSSLNLIDGKLIGVAGSDIFRSVVVDSSGNYIAVGSSASAGAGNDDAYIAKFDSSLNLIDDKLIGGGDSDIFYSVAVDSSGNYIAVGSSRSAGAGSDDCFAVNILGDLSMSGTSASLGYTITAPTFTITSPTFTETAPSFTVSSPTFTVTSPTLTETTPTFTENETLY